MKEQTKVRALSYVFSIVGVLVIVDVLNIDKGLDTFLFSVALLVVVRCWTELSRPDK